ncbi:primosomal protein N' [Bacillus sp. FSL W7-1360]
MIAKVIVDVPTAQTDQLYDYTIPLEWKVVAKPGVRVIVPFGRRAVQGFLMAVVQESEQSNLRALIEVRDPVPVLTEELLALSQWLAAETICFTATALAAMLPAALKAKVTQLLTCHVERHELPPSLQPLFVKQCAVPWKDVQPVLKRDAATVQAALVSGIVSIDYDVQEKGKKRTVRQLQRVAGNLDEQLSLLSAKAKKQRALLTYVATAEKTMPTTVVLEQVGTTRSVLTPLLKQGILYEEEMEVYRDPLGSTVVERSEPLPLTAAQQQVMDTVQTAIVSDCHEVMLLHGVTGSGKTEIYLQAIALVLDKGEEAIMLVPEIVLTPQMVERFKARFGDLVAILHSGLSTGEKYDEWRKIHQGEVRVVVGARSAVFAPFSRLGLIIIDEEHEMSYKQEENPRYHTRDVAIWRGVHHNAPVILGSATPSLESYARAKKGVYTLLSLQERVGGRPLPDVHIVDMREELRMGNRSMFSQALMDALKDRLAKGEQSVLFLNRRGYATFVMCRDCGYVASCTHCDISYTYHRLGHALKCHYCGDQTKAPTVCCECNSTHIRFFGSGTQKVEEELARVLPEARVMRMDVDTTRKKGSHKRLLDAFGAGEADILLGTQMIAKGLDFPHITLVGVLSADTMLHLPDFRSSERTFQLLAQVAGRAGRDVRPGEVVVQTYTPAHYSITLVQQHDYEAFFATEMRARKQGGYPPYYHMALITISDTTLPSVIQTAQNIKRHLTDKLARETVVLGPVVSPIARIKDRYRYQCVLKYKREPKLQKTLFELMRHYGQQRTNKKLQVSMDVCPYFFM